MMVYDTAIIGAGTGGLISAFKLSEGLKKVILIEKLPVPGGVATTFKRKGFLFESSLHFVDSLGEGQEIRNFLKEYALDKELKLIELEDSMRVFYPAHDFVVDFSKDNFISYLKDNFPLEKNNIERLSREIDDFFRQFDGFSSLSLPTWLKFMLTPFIYRKIIKASCLTVDQYIGKYIKDTKLKAILTTIWGFMGLPPSRLSAFYFFIVLRGVFFEKSAHIKGGFIQLFHLLIRRLLEKGSDIRFNTTVSKILTDGKGRIRGVLTESGEEILAKTVISNANAIDSLCNLPDDPAMKNNYRKKITKMEKSLSGIQVYLGLKVPAKNLGMTNVLYSICDDYRHDENFNYCFKGFYDKVPLSVVDHSRIDPTISPAEKGTLLIFTLDNYLNWKDLSSQQYKAKKIEVANILISRVEKYLPGLSSNIEVMEVATPLTISRYGSSPEGAIYGFAQTPNQSVINRLPQKTKIKGLFLAGGWTQPGAGVHGCFVSGLNAQEAVLRFLKHS